MVADVDTEFSGSCKELIIKKAKQVSLNPDILSPESLIIKEGSFD
jgi:hypothetical protein